MLERQLFVFQSRFALSVYINFVWRHISYYTDEYYLHIENNFKTRRVEDLYSNDA